MHNVNINGVTLYFLFYNFLIYGVAGWIYEDIYEGLRQKKLLNRGFLVGPILPLYGVGANLVYLLLPSKDNAVIVFLSGMVLATLLEYVTSYVMEKLFHAKWWDYHDMKLNFQGRICLLASMFWGFLSILMVEVLQPNVNRLIDAIPRRIGNYMAIPITILFVVDVTLTVIGTVELDQKLAKLQDLRMGLERHLEKVKLPEMGKILREKGLPDFETAWKDYLHKARPSEKKEAFKEEEAVTGFFRRYYSQLEAIRAIPKRLLKVFPDLKSEDRQWELSALRRFLSRKK